MNKKRHLLTTTMAGFFLPLGALRAEVICGKVRPLKPVRCICGKLIDRSGGPVAGATVKVVKGLPFFGIDEAGRRFLQDAPVLATVKTASDGAFIFGQLKSGSYELNAEVDGFEPFRSPIVVSNPAKKCRRRLVIMLVLDYPDNCGSYVMKQ